MSLDLSALDSALRSNLYNPQNMFRDTMELFADATNDQLVPVDTTNPMVNLMMYISTQSAISNDQIDRATRRSLAEYAKTINELVPHLDYASLQTIYATPSHITVNLVLPLDELLNAAASNSDGSRYVTIPSDSVFTYSDDTKFTLHHDVMIRILDRDTIDIYYMDNNNPLMDITVPIIEYTKVFKSSEDFQSIEMISIPLTLYQFSTRTEYRSVNASTGFQEDFVFTDQVYHIRIFTKVNGETIEFLTAHGDFKYNPNSETPIAIMQYLADKTIRLKIPDVFIDNGLVGPEITIKILESKGDYEVDMVNDGTFNFVPEFINTNASIETGVNALRQVLNLGAYANTDPAGGVDTPTLDELRSRILSSTTDNTPLGEDQLSAALNEIGYDLSQELNYIGNNVFAASCKLDDYSGSTIDTTIGAMNTDIILNDLKDKKGVIFPEENKAVIMPSAIIDATGYRPKFMGYNDVSVLNNLDQQTLLTRVNEDNLLSPIFYYLLDTRSSTPVYKPFDMDSPEITVPSYMNSNPKSNIKIATSHIQINKVDGSYYIHLMTTANDITRKLADNDVMVQMSTTDEFGSVFSINGTLTGRDTEGNYLFRCELQTAFNLDAKGTTEVLNFYNSIYDSYHMPLESKFSINYIVTATNYVTDDKLMEEAVNIAALPTAFSVCTVEETTITVGTRLDGMFTPIKSSLGETLYETHKSDILKYWETDIYEMENGVKKFYINPDYDDALPTTPDNPKIIFNKIHSKGDPVMDELGNHEYAAREGDVVRDSITGEPIPIATGDMNHLVNIQTLDYKFVLIDYLKTIQKEVKWNLDNDIAPLASRMIQDTELKYTLGNTIGDMEVVIDGDTTSTISNEITIALTVRVSEVVYKDTTLRNNITTLIKTEVAEHLKGSSYIENVLVEAINGKIGSSVISFKIDEISTLGNVQSFQLANSADNMGVKSILSLSDAGEYVILDGIEVNFVK